MSTIDRDGSEVPMIRIGPHEFAPLVWHDRLGDRGRCRACYCPRYAHPVPRWDAARPLGARWGVRWLFHRARFMR